MNKISTKLRQKQTAIPKQILQSRFLEMSVADIEEELQDEIEKNPVEQEPHSKQTEQNDAEKQNEVDFDIYDPHKKDKVLHWKARQNSFTIINIRDIQKKLQLETF